MSDEFARYQRMKAEGWRFCHNRSARKHRKQGHHVRYVCGGLYAWRNPMTADASKLAGLREAASA